jgi:hypothetical protein
MNISKKARKEIDEIIRSLKCAISDLQTAKKTDDREHLDLAQVDITSSLETLDTL